MIDCNLLRLSWSIYIDDCKFMNSSKQRLKWDVERLIRNGA